MAYKRQTKEEKERMHRRRRRQLLGGVLCLLIVLGAASVVSMAGRVVGSLFDDSEERAAYEKLLAPLVMLDPVPFDSLETADQNLLLQAAIWEAIYNEDIADETKYERDETGALIMPAVDVDKNGALLFGPNYVLEHHTFDADGMQFVYDEERMGYIIPITGTTSAYTPKVTKIKTSVKEKRVTVGYVAPPTGFTLEGSLSTEQSEPAFYYDYIFTRQGEGYYLTAITTSDTQPEQSSSSSEAQDNLPLEQENQEQLQQQADSIVAAAAAEGSSSEAA